MGNSLPHSRLSLLIVEDDPAMQEAVAAALADTYTIHTAAAGREACACLCAHRVAAIILDVFLGDEHGLDLMPRFRALADVPILILTGHGSEEIAARALRARATDYLVKPFSLGALRASVARAVQSPDTGPDPLDPILCTHRHLAGHLDAPHTATSLAKDIGVSERQHRRMFQSACGHTPRRYYSLLRLRRAADLLRQTRLAIKQVMEAVGFSTRRTFDRAFKREYGVTPSAFRRHARLGDRSRDVPAVRL